MGNFWGDERSTSELDPYFLLTYMSLSPSIRFTNRKSKHVCRGKFCYNPYTANIKYFKAKILVPNPVQCLHTQSTETKKQTPSMGQFRNTIGLRPHCRSTFVALIHRPNNRWWQNLTLPHIVKI